MNSLFIYLFPFIDVFQSLILSKLCLEQKIIESKSASKLMHDSNGYTFWVIYFCREGYILHLCKVLVTLAQVFSYEFCEIFKNACFYRTPLMAAFVKIICKYFSSFDQYYHCFEYLHYHQFFFMLTENHKLFLCNIFCS